MTLSDWFTLIALCVIAAGAVVLYYRSLSGKTKFDELEDHKKMRRAIDKAMRDMEDRQRGQK